MGYRPIGACAAVAGVWLSIAPAQAEELRLATEGAYPPYNFVDASGELGGFDIAFGEELCLRLDATCEWVVQDWDGLIPSLMQGRYDAIVAAMTRTDERREQIAFTNAYTDTPVQFVGPAHSDLAGAETVEQIAEALEGKTIGVQTATVFQYFIEQQFGETVALRLYDTQDNLGLDLAAGRIDAGLADAVAWEPFLASEIGSGFSPFGPSLTGAAFPVLGEGFGIGLRQEDTALLDRMNQAICAMIEDGTLDALHQEFLGFGSPVICER